MRKKYTMSQEQLDRLIKTINDARSTPLIMLQTGMPESPQEAANRAWCQLGDEMGFDGMSVTPIDQSKPLEFEAEPKS